MRALVVKQHGGIDVLEVQERPDPQPAPGEVLVRVAAAGVNFKDVYMREGVYPGEPPFVLGAECAGTVEAVGSGVTDVAVGDVVATTDAGGGMAELATVASGRVVRVPDGIDAETAAAVMLQGLTAHYLVRSTYPVAEGDGVLVHAAAGGVGQLLVQLTKARGAFVVATVGSAAKADIARDLGADAVVRYDEVTEPKQLAAAIRGHRPDGLHVAYDGVGKATWEASLAALRPRGMFVLFGAASGQVPPFDLQLLNRGGSLFATRPTLVDYVRATDELRARAAEVFTAVADGTVRLEIGGRYGLDEAPRAYEDLEGRRTTGKLLVVP
ncbi:quinone oxidoreductase family protein [Jatrophihabitans fulvus]